MSDLSDVIEYHPATITLEVGWLGTHDDVERARREAVARAFVAELVAGAVDCFLMSPPLIKIRGPVSFSPSLRFFWRFGVHRGFCAIAALEVFWEDDGPTLRVTSPTCMIMGVPSRGLSWNIRRCPT